MKEYFKAREATVADVPALTALHVAAFNETHGYGSSPSTEMRQWQWQKIFEDKQDRWFCIVMEDEAGKLVGFAKGQPYDHADHSAFAGELNKIYLLKRYHRLGLGRQLLCKAANEFLQRGINTMLLFGDAGNPSNGFYERMGAEKLFAKNGEFHGGYGWKDLGKLAETCKNNS